MSVYLDARHFESTGHLYTSNLSKLGFTGFYDY